MSEEIGLTGFGLALDPAYQQSIAGKYWHLQYNKEFDDEEQAKNAFALVGQMRAVLADVFDVHVRFPTSMNSAVDFESGKRKWNVYSRFSVSFKEPK